MLPAAKRPERFYFLLVFWGPEFRGFVCRYLLPSLLAPGNLPALRNPAGAKLLVVTTRRDWQELEKEPVFARVRKLIPVEFIWDEDGKANVHKYRRMSNAHAALAERCYRDRAIAVNLNPDSIYPDGCIAEGQRLALDQGADVVLCAAIRFDQSGIVQELDQRGLLVPGQPLALSMREAVALGLRHLHPETRASAWDAPNFARLHEAHARSYFLTCCLWRVPGEDGALLITHNWSPFIVNYAVLAGHDTSALDGRALDGAYIFENFPRHTDAIHVVTDSDSLFPLGMTPREDMVPPQGRVWFDGLGVLSEWTRGLLLSRTVHDRQVDAHRRRFYRTIVRWHTRDLNERWRDTEQLAARLVSIYVANDIEAPGADSSLVRKLWYVLARPSLM